ncbi:serine hydrolase domain-containing protein [Streptomyces sp. NPDC058964]|uniref:serine hydrolase domain-containing protein n=1 Tax=Streptomyces sp. NPDC058964 TaxID=3346681 RepID=UPI003691DCB4
MPHSSWTADRVRRRIRRRAVAAVGTAVVAGVLLGAAPGAHADAWTPPQARHSQPVEQVMRKLTPEVRAQLDRAVRNVLRTTNTPGVTVGLWAPGKGSYVRAFGTADKATGAPMSPGFNMRIGSVTKTFTVTALLRLADEKRVGLDDPVSKYVAGVPQGDHITLRHLAEMRSGLFNFMRDPDFGAAFVTDHNRVFTRSELLAYSFKHPVGFAPGSKFDYSNTNTLLLAMVVEKVTGQRFDRYVERHVLRPAHLDHTFMPRGTEFPAPHAHGYTDQTPHESVADATYWNPTAGGPAGAMISDLRDLRSWASILADGGLLSPATQAERMKLMPTGVPGLSYGLGVFGNHGWIGHNGSLPGYQTVMVRLPQAGATLVVHTTSDIAFQGQALSTKFAKAVTSIVTPKNVYDTPAARPTHA